MNVNCEVELRQGLDLEIFTILSTQLSNEDKEDVVFTNMYVYSTVCADGQLIVSFKQCKKHNNNNNNLKT